MESERPNFFAGPYLERRVEAREDPEWVAAAWADDATVYVVVRGTAHLLHGDPPRAALLTRAEPLVRSAPATSLTLLGWFRGARCVLITLPPERAAPPPGMRFEELRPLSALLPADEAGLLAYARALAVWRARTRHCGLCGAPTAPIRAGHCLVCSNHACAEEFFPRIDPAIIVLVSDGERALLGRQASWPARRYSTIAGFVEPGESLEDAVAREVEEETGVRIVSAGYDSSQPWPFPSSLMLGFRAQAPAGSAVRVSGELEDARWFTRAQLTSGEALAPPSHSISWRLISRWLDGGQARVCLLVLAWAADPRYRLIVAANRDEFHERPAAPLAKWPEPPHILAGRDLRASGTWLGLDPARRFGVVTNFRELQGREPAAPSRGRLIPQYLAGADRPGQFFARLEPAAKEYSGFNLLLTDAASLWYGSNRAAPFARELPPGVYGLSNELLDTPWPKLVRVKARFQQWLAQPDATAAGLFALLADRTEAAEADGPLPTGGLPREWEQILSAPFVAHPTYGTRCSTVLLLEAGGALYLAERRFDAAGQPAGESEFRLNAGDWP